ncbi:MAG: DNA cytosine methyltransferase [Tannerella sp.]|jgi:DNA (cytosine-5)-methyltransferase 1|nr:DNA cytosine methyltransferase [Tannerella sp.]
MRFYSIDLFAGCGGLSEGLRQAGFETKVAVEIEPKAVLAFKMNHTTTFVFQKDIRTISAEEIKEHLNGEPLHLLAGCPPCQGFSSIRRLNRPQNVDDERNDLILEYFRLVKELKPLTIMMENVPALEHYDKFQYVVKELDKLGYNTQVQVLNVKDYEVPQSRKRLVMVGSILGNLEIAKPINKKVTVRDTIENIESEETTTDAVHKVYPKHTERVMQRIRLTPKNGGSRKDLPAEYILPCHKKENVGFNDIYGRLRWNDYSTTITGGCLNPSKGRFLHPEKDRCITAREAALLQSFPEEYKFPTNIPATAIALLIGNALPPKFSYYQSLNIYKHIQEHIG